MARRLVQHLTKVLEEVDEINLGSNICFYHREKEAKPELNKTEWSIARAGKIELEHKGLP